MSDLPPMDPCPYSKTGRHSLCPIVPESDEGDITFFCDRCGALRRMPVKGAMSRSLDGLTADEIAEAMRGAKR